ncbi:hypothetical protein BDZ89DRAFT_1063555 [Hymenopellis radicata]|nr:hypothetical protein BDZ89DRAFT_1063555 [Hymenopellis radicata]
MGRRRSGKWMTGVNETRTLGGDRTTNTSYVLPYSPHFGLQCKTTSTPQKIGSAFGSSAVHGLYAVRRRSIQQLLHKATCLLWHWEESASERDPWRTLKVLVSLLSAQGNLRVGMTDGGGGTKEEEESRHKKVCRFISGSAPTRLPYRRRRRHIQEANGYLLRCEEKPESKEFVNTIPPLPMEFAAASATRAMLDQQPA